MVPFDRDERSSALFTHNQQAAMRRFLSKTFGFLLAFSLAVTPALADQGHQASTSSSPTSISASELNQAAQLYTEIETIYATYETKLIAATTKDEKTALKTRRDQKIENAIQEAPLSVERYQTIQQRSDEDGDLRRRFKKHIREARIGGQATTKRSFSQSNSSGTQGQQCSPSSK